MSDLSVPITIAVSPEVAQDLPADPDTRAEVLALGLQQWHIRQALDAYQRGEGTLAYAAQRAGVSIRQIIPLAYAYGLTPRVDPVWLSSRLTPDQATRL
jgi:hypothetical protein